MNFDKCFLCLQFTSLNIPEPIAVLYSERWTWLWSLIWHQNRIFTKLLMCYFNCWKDWQRVCVNTENIRFLLNSANSGWLSPPTSFFLFSMPLLFIYLFFFSSVSSQQFEFNSSASPFISPSLPLRELPITGSLCSPQWGILLPRRVHAHTDKQEGKTWSRPTVGACSHTLKQVLT